MSRTHPATARRRSSGRRPATWRWLALATVTLTMPLVQTAGCADIAIRSVVNGFFNGFNTWLADSLGTSNGAGSNLGN